MPNSRRVGPLEIANLRPKANCYWRKFTSSSTGSRARSFLDFDAREDGWTKVVVRPGALHPTPGKSGVIRLRPLSGCESTHSAVEGGIVVHPGIESVDGQ